MCRIIRSTCTVILDVELRKFKLELNVVNCLYTLVYLIVKKNIFNFVLTWTGKKSKSMDFGVVLSVPNLDLVPMILIAAFSMIPILSKLQ